MVQTFYSWVATGGARRPHIVNWLRLNLKNCGLLGMQATRPQHVLLLPRVLHVLYLSFQKLVPGFELQSTTKYVPMHPEITHDREYIDVDTHILETSLSYSKLTKFAIWCVLCRTMELLYLTLSRLIEGTLVYEVHL